MDHSEVKHLPKIDHTPAELGAVGRVLWKAADLMEERGHCRGTAWDEEGRICAMEAIYRASGWPNATGSGRLGDIASNAFEDALGLPNPPAGERRRPGAIFSDSSPTESVIGALRRVALTQSD